MSPCKRRHVQDDTPPRGWLMGRVQHLTSHEDYGHYEAIIRAIKDWRHQIRLEAQYVSGVGHAAGCSHASRSGGSAS
jgi:hypothetical protein